MGALSVYEQLMQRLRASLLLTQLERQQSAPLSTQGWTLQLPCCPLSSLSKQEILVTLVLFTSRLLLSGVGRQKTRDLYGSWRQEVTVEEIQAEERGVTFPSTAPSSSSKSLLEDSCIVQLAHPSLVS